MSHVRQQIRDAAALTLIGLTTTGVNVFKSRVATLRDTDLPCLVVRTNDEQIDSDGITDDCAMERQLTLAVSGFAKVTAALDDTLDTIAIEVETALANTRLGGLIHRCALQSIRVDIDDSLDKPVGEIVLEFQTQYFTSPADPGTAL